MALDTSGFNLAIPQQGVITPALANVAPYSPNFRGMEFKPFDIRPPSTAIAQGIAAALGSVGQGIQVAYQNQQHEKELAQQRADKERAFAFEQQKYQDELGFKQRAEARAVEERMKGALGDKFPGESTGMPPSSDASYDSAAAASKNAEDGTTKPIQGAGVAGKPSIEFSPPTSKDVTPSARKPSIETSPPTMEVTNPNLSENIPSTTITPPTAEDSLQVTPNFVTKPPYDATYIAPSPAKPAYDFSNTDQQIKALQSAESQPLQSLAPFVSTSSGQGPAGVPSLPLSQPQTLHELRLQQQKAQDQAVADMKNGVPLYKVDTTQMNVPTDKVPTQAQTTPKFEVPALPSGADIPRPVTTSNYEQAVAAQYKDHGFYFNPISKLETHVDPTTGQQWYKVVPEPLPPTAIEAKIKHLDSMSEHFDRLQTQKQNIINREQTGFGNDQRIKAFQAPNGMQQSFARFVKDYDAIAKNPEASGISDIGLLDMFGRAEGGGRITEGQAALALQSVGIFDKPELLLEKLKGGARLSPNQRDQMLRVIAEDHAAQANIANQAVMQTRQKLKAQGITDELMLPQPYIVPITKWEAEQQQKEIAAEGTQLKLAKIQAQQKGDTKTLKQIEQRGSELQKQIDDLKEMKKRSKGSAIINAYDIEHTPQGWGGGAVINFTAQP
jgi:hypothetical protein